MTPRGWRLVLVGSLATMVGTSALGAALGARFGEPPLELRVASVAVIGLAFLVFVASVPPVVVRTFIAGHVRLGNQAHPMVRFLVRHERRVVWAVWALWALGAAIALPVAIRDVMSAP